MCVCVCVCVCCLLNTDNLIYFFAGNNLNHLSKQHDLFKF